MYRDHVADSHHAGSVTSCCVRCYLLIVPFDRTAQRYPVALDLDGDLAVRNVDVPLEDVDGPSRDLGIAGLGVAGEADLQLLGDRLHTENPGRRVLGRRLLRIVLDKSRNCHDAAFCRHSDMGGVDVRHPLKLVRNVALQLIVSPHIHSPVVRVEIRYAFG